MPTPKTSTPVTPAPRASSVARCAVGACGARRGATAERRTGRALDRLDTALKRCGVPQVRYLAQLTMLDGRFNGATGEGVYIAVASRICNERARAELKRRGDAWRQAGLGAFATLEAVEEVGL